MISSEDSVRINLLRFPLIVGVVFIHGGAASVTFGQENVELPRSVSSDLVINLISQGLARLSVPLFFLLSGYLFFVGFEWSFQQYAAKLRTRVRTLVVPYYFWNCLTIGLIAIAQAVPTTQIYLSQRIPPLEEVSVYDLLQILSGVAAPPPAFQFWFIRDLFIMVLLVPAIYTALLLAPISYLAILFVCWFVGIWPVSMPASVAALFFSTGMYLSVRRKNLFCLDRYGPILVVAYLVLLLLDALSKNKPYTLYLHQTGVIIGIPTALFATKLLAHSPGLRMRLVSLSHASFFVFAAHQPLLTVLRKVFYIAFQPKYATETLLLYFSLPILVILMTVGAYRTLFLIAPRFLAFITGGR